MSYKNKPHWVYVAGKVSDDTSSIQDVIAQFEQAGFEITHDWTRANGIRKPYLEHVERNQAAALDMKHGVRQCDVFVLLCFGDIYGAMAEFGMALSEPSTDRFGRRLIYVVGDTSEMRQSIFFALPGVLVCSSVEEVLVDLGK